MDIEQLKLILDTVKSTTGDAKLVTLVYIAYSTVASVVPAVGVLLALKMLLSGIPNIITMAHENTQFATTMRALLLPRERGYVSGGERTRMIAIVQGALADHVK